MYISISPIDIGGMSHDVTMLPFSVRGTAKRTDRQRKSDRAINVLQPAGCDTRSALRARKTRVTPLVI